MKKLNTKYDFKKDLKTVLGASVVVGLLGNIKK